MRNTRDDEEACSLLTDEVDDIDLRNKINLPKLHPVIMRGVALNLAKWPSHLFTIFTSVCILSIALLFITLAATIIFAIDVNPRISRNVKMEEYPNLYFVKHASHAWSQDELCAIESSAREYPDLNIYLVNFFMTISPVNISLTLHSAITEDSANALTLRYMNVQSIDVVAHTLFRKSPLERVYEKFDAGTLLMAVKSQLLWNYSGIAMDPSQVKEIGNLRGYICRSTESCKLMKNAAISLDGSLQVSPCPCHAFYELFLKVLSNKFNNKGRIVKDTYKSFCNGQEKCLGAEIFTYKSVNITEHLLCPIILPRDFQASKRVGRVICSLCDHWSMGNHLCVIFLGLIGTMITAFDIIRIMNYKLPRRSVNRRRNSDLVPHDVERDLKLMTSILGIEHYTLIMLGAMTGYPMLHTPWLLMQLCVIVVEIGVFFMKLILDGLHIKLDGILLAIFTVHNWLQPRTLYLRVMCLVVTCLSSITLELGARSPLGHSVTKSTAFSYIFRRSYNVIIKVTMGRFLSSILSTILLTIGEKYKIPFLYIPWMFNTLQGIFFYEAPTLLKWTHNQIPYVVIPASTFAFITFILFLEQLFHWCDVFASFMRTWVEYIHRKKVRVLDEIENMKNQEKIDTINGEKIRLLREFTDGISVINTKDSWRRNMNLQRRKLLDIAL